MITSTTMANFARSFKSPSYLSPRLRPTLPGRSISTSSDLSLSASSNNSPRSDDHDDLILSGRNTPTPSGAQGSNRLMSWDSDGAASPGVGVRDEHFTLSTSTSRAKARDRSRSRSRPIAIELPQLKRISTAPARTPPEPLSARGDLPGGYFPLHEDPNSRIHRPHPFQHKSEAKPGAQRFHGPTLDVSAAHAERHETSSSQRLSLAQTNTPVASYLAPGFHDSPLPMGKYYPSNYENRNNRQGAWLSPTSGSLGGGVNAPTSHPAAESHGASAESDVRRKLQQYQRDMIAQASMAANELLSGHAGSSGKMGSGVPIREIKFQTQAHLKPISPRLLPMGSPGPVTPMSLESGSGGGILDVPMLDSTTIPRSPLAGAPAAV